MKSEIIFILGIWYYQLSIDLLKNNGARQDRTEGSEISSIILESQRLYLKFINPKNATYACYFKRSLFKCQKKTVNEQFNPASISSKTEQHMEQWDRDLLASYDEPSKKIWPLNYVLRLLCWNKYSSQSSKCSMQDDTGSLKTCPLPPFWESFTFPPTSLACTKLAEKCIKDPFKMCRVSKSFFASLTLGA